MKLPILNISNSDNIDQFIAFWSVLYHYPKDNLYLDRISKSRFEREDVKILFEWKNGMPLEGSGAKEWSLVTKILQEEKIFKINSFKEQSVLELNLFLVEFKNLSAVWKIFLLHIIKPQEYPIYDQHIHRAFYYINSQEWQSINETINDKKKELFYFKEYLPFVKSSKFTDLKKMDEAFFAFGQFLKTKNQRKLF